MEQIKKSHVEITVRGRVQGVGFRFSARNMAQLLGIKGFVRNQEDGSVYIEAEGVENQLNQFIYWCHTGPHHAYVEDVSIVKGEIKGFSYFDITH